MLVIGAGAVYDGRCGKRGLGCLSGADQHQARSLREGGYPTSTVLIKMVKLLWRISRPGGKFVKGKGKTLTPSSPGLAMG